jgi:hypothetical protein
MSAASAPEVEVNAAAGGLHAERVLSLGYGGMCGSDHLEHGALASGEGSYADNNDADIITEQGVADKVAPVGVGEVDEGDLGVGEVDEGDLGVGHQDSCVVVVLSKLLGRLQT